MKEQKEQQDPANKPWRDYMEHEARCEAMERKLARLPPLMSKSSPKRSRPNSLPAVSREQAAACGAMAFATLDRLQRAIAERVGLSDLVLAAAWVNARSAIRFASKWQPPATEVRDGVA